MGKFDINGDNKSYKNQKKNNNLNIYPLKNYG